MLLFGYTDIDKMITNLERLTDRRPDVLKRIHEGRVKAEFLQTMKSIG